MSYFSIRWATYIFICCISLVCSSCTYYRIGVKKPPSLTNIHTIALPMMLNRSFEPRANAIGTSALADILAQDGTYRISSTNKADAILETTLLSVNQTVLNTNRFDFLKPEELYNNVVIEWKLKDATNPLKVIKQGTSTGKTVFSGDSNLQRARENALPEAMENAARDIVNNLSIGY